MKAKEVRDKYGNLIDEAIKAHAVYKEAVKSDDFGSLLETGPAFTKTLMAIGRFVLDHQLWIEIPDSYEGWWTSKTIRKTVGGRNLVINEEGDGHFWWYVTEENVELKRGYEDTIEIAIYYAEAWALMHPKAQQPAE